MGKTYRPFLLARAGELNALKKLRASALSQVAPVFRVPERSWDFDNDAYSKSHDDHLRAFAPKIQTAWEGGRGFLDLSLLDSEGDVDGRHPFDYLALAASKVSLTPVLSADSSIQSIDAAKRLHANGRGGIGILLRQSNWTTVNPQSLQDLMLKVGVSPADVDLFLDYEDLAGALIQVALEAELSALQSLGAFRSITVGGSSFPDLGGAARGITEYDRTEWQVYSELQRKLAQDDRATPDFFDNGIQNVDQIDQNMDPRVLSFSATLRYTVAEKWLIAKGDLFKGRGGSGLGGAALLAPLSTLRTHPEHGQPIRSLTDDWIDDVIARDKKPGGPQQWREWGTIRHVQVVAHQLANLT